MRLGVRGAGYGYKLSVRPAQEKSGAGDEGSGTAWSRGQSPAPATAAPDSARFSREGTPSGT